MRIFTPALDIGSHINARVHRAAERHWQNHKNGASAAPVQRIVRRLFTLKALSSGIH
jgi:hypothetical protein